MRPQNNIGKLVLRQAPKSTRRRRRYRPTKARRSSCRTLLNPRYSYGAGKLISEVMAVNFGRKYFERVLIFRPHNIYGPDMGNEHVIPQLALRLHAAAKKQPSGKLRFEIQGTGQETRSFCFIDDLVAGVMVMREKGEHLGIYHVGTTEEVTIADLARRIAGPRRVEIKSSPARYSRAARCAAARHFQTGEPRLFAAYFARAGLTADA